MKFLCILRSEENQTSFFDEKKKTMITNITDMIQ